MIVINVLILLLAFVSNYYVLYWGENLRNGLRFNAPAGFINNPGVYFFVDVAVLFILLFFWQIPWYITIAAYLVSFKTAFFYADKKYNGLLNEIIKREEKEAGRIFSEEERMEKLTMYKEAQKIANKIR